jgi:hemolysin III
MLAPSTKPLLRGRLHQEAFFTALGACVLLLIQSSQKPGRIFLVASLIYSAGLLMLFGFSAVYHRLNWQPRARNRLKRADHCAIFILIAATTTPLALFALPENQGKKLLWLIWLAALLGITQSIAWVSAPKWVTALLCIGVGWMSLPFLNSIRESLTVSELVLLVTGGLIYSFGAIFYAMKKPNLLPGIFGYHELFHLFTILAATVHFAVIYRLLSRS